MIDWSWRITYWIGFRMARILWWLRRPNHHGALVALWYDGSLLVVRQSYRTALSLPGGGINRGEDPRDAASRELVEELGLAVPSNALTLAQEMIIRPDFRREHVRVFELYLHAEPKLRIDNREIVTARFVDPQELANNTISAAMRTYLQYNRSYRPNVGPN